VPARRLLLLLCAASAANTCAIGAFPALLPELAADVGLADWQAGLVAGAWGFARMTADVPVGLFITHHLRRALALGPAILGAGALVLATGGALPALLLGRWLMGTGHALTMLGSLTAILRHAPPRAVASWLNALEFAAMLGMVSGVTLLSLLPRGLAWDAAYLVACAPIAANVVFVPALLRALPREPRGVGAPLFARSATSGSDARVERRGGAPAMFAKGEPGGSAARLTRLAFVAGGAIAVSYASVEQFGIPIRSSREFGLDRVGIARLLLVAQVCDVLALLPAGALADRHGAPRVLGVMLVVFATGVALIGFGTLPLVVAGAVLFGLSMAGWMLPLSVLRAVTPPERVAWRTALYRVSVDGGIFLGPFVSGLVAGGGARALTVALTGTLGVVGVLLLRRSARP